MPSSEETLRKQKVKTAGANGQPSEPARSNTELVVITGMSGSGKASVLKAFEDMGYYAVDNLPVELIPHFAELARESSQIERAALVADIREGHGLPRLPGILKSLKRSLPTQVI